jgi:hypothetical protein
MRRLRCISRRDSVPLPVAAAATARATPRAEARRRTASRRAWRLRSAAARRSCVFRSGLVARGRFCRLRVACSLARSGGINRILLRCCCISPAQAPRASSQCGSTPNLPAESPASTPGGGGGPPRAPGDPAAGGPALYLGGACVRVCLYKGGNTRVWFPPCLTRRRRVFCQGLSEPRWRPALGLLHLPAVEARPGGGLPRRTPHVSPWYVS